LLTFAAAFIEALILIGGTHVDPSSSIEALQAMLGISTISLFGKLFMFNYDNL